MYINHNQMAGNVANTLTSHYSNLATSTQRLSSGLRVNSAADDAAGLAIRELMRADISALQQGVRNANDAISLIQTADGALGIIDEKLIRMKELAEQAATGTYDSTQRLMIESEYQAMASEITRIANATDFNGIHLLNGKLEGTHDGSGMESSGALKVHFGSGNNSAEDYYYIEIEEMTAAALGIGNSSTFADVTDRAVDAFTKKLTDEINNAEPGKFTDAQKGQLLSQVSAAADNYRAAIESVTKGDNPAKLAGAYSFWSAPDTAGADTGFLVDGKTWNNQDLGTGTNSRLMNEFLAAGARQEYVVGQVAADTVDGNAKTAHPVDQNDVEYKAMMAQIKSGIQSTVDAIKADTSFKAGVTAVANNPSTDPDDAEVSVEATVNKLNNAILAAAKDAGMGSEALTALAAKLTDTGNTTIADKLVNNGAQLGATATDTWASRVDAAVGALFDVAPTGTTVADVAADDKVLANAVAADQQDKAENALGTFWNGLRETEKESLRYAFGQAAIYNMTQDPTTLKTNYGIGVGTTELGFGADATGAAIAGADELLDAALQAGYDKVKDMDFAGHTIETQEDAQHALNALNDAIVQKDKTRAHLGALQNRLENTVSNLTTQSENLQAAESRISDVDVATEMTQFVRNQILTQSAVAMLSQANSMPQMAMQLIH